MDKLYFIVVKTGRMNAIVTSGREQRCGFKSALAAGEYAEKMGIEGYNIQESMYSSSYMGYN